VPGRVRVRRPGGRPAPAGPAVPLGTARTQAARARHARHGRTGGRTARLRGGRRGVRRHGCGARPLHARRRRAARHAGQCRRRRVGAVRHAPPPGRRRGVPRRREHRQRGASARPAARRHAGCLRPCVHRADGRRVRRGARRPRPPPSHERAAVRRGGGPGRSLLPRRGDAHRRLPARVGRRGRSGRRPRGGRAARARRRLSATPIGAAADAAVRTPGQHRGTARAAGRSFPGAGVESEGGIRMKWVMRALQFAALTSAFAAIGTTAGASNPRLNAQVVASWPFTEPYGSFAESMALGPNGFLYVSRTVWGDEHNYGYVERFRPSGAAHSVVAGPIDLGAWELLTGIAFDPQGHLYVTVAPFLDEGLALAPGVLRVESNGTLTRVLTLPVSSFPNGLAVHGGYLYVADSSGPIWR